MNGVNKNTAMRIYPVEYDGGAVIGAKRISQGVRVSNSLLRKKRLTW